MISFRAPIKEPIIQKGQNQKRPGGASSKWESLSLFDGWPGRGFRALDAEKEPFLSLSACGVNAVSTVGNPGLTLYVVGCRLSAGNACYMSEYIIGFGVPRLRGRLGFRVC